MITRYELRIGNLVHPDNTNDVVRIIPEDFKNTEHLNPIPLTEDWLIRFGFTKDYYLKTRVIYIWGRLKFEIVTDKTSIFLDDELFCHIDSNVHTLQNWWFANLGEELTLKEE